MLTDDFWTILEPGTAHTRVLGSRFSAHAFGVEAESQFESSLADTKKQFFDASHHCWAWIVRANGELQERMSDAGEPKGTAGLPILHEVRKRMLENCGVIVTRWFGGTKLGTGGLVRSYGECAAHALESAKRIQRKTGITVIVDAPFELQSIVYSLASKSFAIVEATGEVNGTEMLVKLRRQQAGGFIVALRDYSAGRLTARIGTEWIS